MFERSVQRYGAVACVLLVLLLGTCETILANPLSPDHPYWTDPGPGRESFVRHWREGAAQRPKGILLPSNPDDVRAKGLTRVSARLLVVPVLYASDADAPVSQEQLETRFFGAGEGSFAGYWNAASAGRLRLTGLVTPWVRVPDDLTTYRNVLDGIFRGAAGPDRLVRDAMREVAEVVDELVVFDDDGPDGVPGSGDDDGVLDLLVVLHSGPGFENDPQLVGPRMLALQDRVEPDDELFAASGVFADAYVVAAARGPLGVWVHEFGHLLGLEDLYDLDATAFVDEPRPGGGLGLWSLMASGTWGGDGARPSQLDAISRQLLGWDEVVEVEDAADLDLAPVDPSATSSVVLRPLGEWDRERYVLENRRRREGAVLDGGLPGSGVLIYRVDESHAGMHGPGASWIELLQADGRDDLGQLTNFGDATDPFDGGTGADVLGPDTSPSSRSSLDDPLRLPPVVRVDPASSDGAHPVSIRMGVAGQLRLESAYFEDAVRGDRSHLLPQEEAPIQLRFASVGEAAVTSASVRVVDMGARLEVLDPGPFDLTQIGAEWEATNAITVRDLANGEDDTGLRLGLTVNGGAEREIELGLGIGIGPGLGINSLFDFEPVVLAAANDTTRFEPLQVVDLPLPADAGWQLRTNGQVAYANGVDVALVGPWFAAPRSPRIHLWSRARTETSLPGQVFDGGVLQVHRPDRGWRPLPVDEGEVVHVVERSAAAVRNEFGFGGALGEWSRAGGDLPTDLLPLRLRLRFASDGTFTDEGWSVAGLGTDVAPAVASIEVQLQRDGSVFATALLQGDVSDLVTLRYRSRRLDSETWEVASSLLTATEGQTVRKELTLPSDARRLRIGLFAEVGDGSQTPRLKLGEAPFTRPRAAVLPSLLRNPVRGTAVFQLPAQDSALAFRIFDLRGREVHSFRIPAGVTWFEWEGTDAAGTRVAAGRYFLAREDVPERTVAFTYIP